MKTLHRKHVSKSTVRIIFVILALAAFFAAPSCTPSKGCYATKGMSGY